jgi:hypothetical protein
MKAVIYRASGPTVVDQGPGASSGAATVSAGREQGSGVCDSDLWAYRGRALRPIPSLAKLRSPTAFFSGLGCVHVLSTISLGDGYALL